MSREIFANGAVKAAKFLAGMSKPGMYDMSMLVENNQTMRVLRRTVSQKGAP